MMMISSLLFDSSEVVHSTWKVYCRATLASCDGSNCMIGWGTKLEEDSPCPGTCVVQTVGAALHLVFLLVWIFSLFWRYRSASSRDDGREKHLKHHDRSTFPRRLWCGLIGCWTLSLQHFGLGVFTLVQSLHGVSWPVHFLAIEIFQVIIWLILSFIACKSWNRTEQKFSAFVSTWWTVGFVLSVVAVIPKFLQGQTWNHNYMIIQITMIPVSGFLCLLSVKKKTTSVTATDPLSEPLLHSENGTASQPEITPYATAGYFSLATLSWIGSLIAKGARKPLELNDIPSLAPNDQSNYQYNKFKENWEVELGRKLPETPSFYRAVVKTFWQRALFNIVLACLTSIAAYVGPYLIEDFVEYLAGRRRFPNEGLFLVSMFFLSHTLENFAQRQWFLGMQILGLNFKSALTSYVFRKGLRLSNQARQGHTSGEIINYVTIDVQRMGDFSWYLGDMMSLPLQMFLALLILYKSLGLAAISAFLASIFVVVINIPLNVWQDKFQDKLMDAKDTRMKSLTESLRSMRILKLQGWETRYLSKLESLRDVEYMWLRRISYVNAGMSFLFWTAPLVVAVASFSTCVLAGIPLTSGKVLSALAVFISLTDPLAQLPELFSQLAQTKTSADRLQTYLLQEELQEDAVTRVSSCAEEEIVVRVSGGEFKWDPSAGTSTLLHLNFQVKRGQRIAICGPVGSGKSSLLSCLLGEIPKLSGTVSIAGTTAYVAQSSWIQSGKIEDNITFGKSMDRRKYRETVRVCSLDKDLKTFAFGDQTIIGERGINMSGGQKQRIQLARAVYQDADIYLLDDPFSAVDAHTGSDMFSNCILGTLSSKTVFYVTHQVEFLSAADLVLVLRNGTIVQSGKYDELLHAGSDLSALVNAHKDALSLVSASGYNKKEGEMGLAAAVEGKREGGLGLARGESFKESVAVETKQLVQDEELERGVVNFSVYWTYVTAVARGAFFPAVVLAAVCFQILNVASNYWMAWSTPASKDDEPKVSTEVLMVVYSVFAFGSGLFVCMRSLLVSAFGLMTAQKFFKNMLRSVFSAPMSFFDSTPNGRILSRASSDQNTLDSEILYTITGVLLSSLQIVGIITVMCQVTWLVLVVVTPVAVVAVWLQGYYLKSARQLQRLVGVLKAPVIHHYAESIAGSATIRGFQQEQRFLEKSFFYFDQCGQAMFHNFSAAQWLMFRIEMLATIVFAFCLVYVVVFPVGALTPGIAGLAVTYGLQLNVMLTWWLWDSCNLENRIISVERINQFSQLDKEAPYFIEESRPPAHWPKDGAIEFENLKVQYNAHSPLVLHGLTFRVQGGHKIGIVGRTGSGKSTLIQTLFRIVEPTEGSIAIDGIDITRIGLHDLRLKLSVIPQDPTLFEGTMRFNFDPLEQYTDSEIWEALDKCQLGDVVRSTTLKLDSPVTENGENWSVGQRQLLCLGRALLRRTRILVLDEATASVDSTTDGLIQQTIRKEFRNCTVLTVAHRIPTVVDSDYVLVLSDGKLAEYDTPTNLLQSKSSLFYKLVSEYSTRSGSAGDLSAMDV